MTVAQLNNTTRVHRTIPSYHITRILFSKHNSFLTVSCKVPVKTVYVCVTARGYDVYREESSLAGAIESNILIWILSGDTQV